MDYKIKKKATTNFSTSKINAYAWFILYFAVFILSCIPLFIIIFKIENNSIWWMYSDDIFEVGGYNLFTIIFFLMPIPGFLVFRSLFLSTYWYLNTINDKLEFSGIWRAKRFILPDEIVAIKRLLRINPHGSGLDLVQFILKDETVSLNNDIENIQDLFDWLKLKNQNIKIEGFENNNL